MKRFIAIFIVALPAGCFSTMSLFAQQPAAEPFIVQFRDDVKGQAAQNLAAGLASDHAGVVRYVWDDELPGMALTVSQAEADEIALDPRVKRVERDLPLQFFANAQSSAPWQLDRIDQRTLPLNGTLEYCSGGAGVNVYVMDTGVRGTHQEFWRSSTDHTSRVDPGFQAGEMQFYAGAPNNPCTDANDCGEPSGFCTGGGHGTAVASLIGGLTYGIAKGATIIPVRIANCVQAGKVSDAIDGLKKIGIDYAARHQPAVINMSFGYDVAADEPETLFESCLKLLLQPQPERPALTMVVAAGNGNKPANTVSPARLAHGNGGHVISVGGSSPTDKRWVCRDEPGDSCFPPDNPGSNYGVAVDLFAPSRVVAAAGLFDVVNFVSVPSDTAARQEDLSGTSFASPLVAGSAALVLEGNRWPSIYSPDRVWQHILTDTTPGVMQSTATAPLSGSPNRLLYASRYCRDTPQTPSDRDGDGISEVSLYSAGGWHRYAWGGAYLGGLWTGGSTSCIPALGDYDGNGTSDLAQLCNGAWFFYRPDGTVLKAISIGGPATDIPVPADYDGDGDDDVVIYRDGAWLFYDYATAAYTRTVWTGPGPNTVPAPLDYDGDGKADFSVYAGSAWHFYNDNGTYFKGIWIGVTTGKPVPGDYDGDGDEDPVLFNAGAWHFYDLATSTYLGGVFTAGGANCQPSPLDYDGDGIVDLTLYEAGAWHHYTRSGTYLGGVWTGGLATDRALSRRHLIP